MKKKYIAPRSGCLKINHANLLASSIQYGGEGEGRPAQSVIRDNLIEDSWDE